MDARSVTSQDRARTREASPSAVAVRDLTAASSLSALRAAMATDAPCWIKPSAMPSPIPPLPPVTKATLLERLKRVMVGGWGCLIWGLRIYGAEKCGATDLLAATATTLTDCGPDWSYGRRGYHQVANVTTQGEHLYERI